MKRVVQIPRLAKRRISIAVSAHHATEATVAETPEHVHHTHETPKQQTVSVAQFMKLAYQPYEVKQRSGINGQQIIVPLENEQIILGREIRTALENDDAKKLHSAVSDIRKSKHWSVITEGLTRPEISVLLKSLIRGQLSGLKTLQEHHNVVDRDIIKSAMRSLNRLSQNIGAVFITLRHTEGFSFTVSDWEVLLEHETLNYHYPEASKLISIIESTKLCQDSVLFHNLKFRVLADTDPSNWKISQNTTMTPHAYRGSLKNTIAFSQLLMNFSKASKTFTPNLTSHKEILCGFGKSGDLHQVRTHIEQIWGITLTGGPQHVLPMASALYPDDGLLIAIVNVFGYNSQTSEALEYAKKFLEHYEIDVKKNVQLWKVLTRMMEIENRGDVNALANEFEQMWNLMKELQTRSTSAMYYKRFDILSKANRYVELSNDLPKLWKKCHEADSISQKMRAQKVLTTYLKGIIMSLYSSLPREKAVPAVKSHIKRYAIDSAHYQELLESRKEIVQTIQKSIDSFEAMQRQFDEEDDEGALW